jgi:hypothetical protein
MTQVHSGVLRFRRLALHPDNAVAVKTNLYPSYVVTKICIFRSLHVSFYMHFAVLKMVIFTYKIGLYPSRFGRKQLLKS